MSLAPKIGSGEIISNYAPTENHYPDIVESLGISAAKENIDAIDMLCRLSLRHDDAGFLAVNKLFELFSGKCSATEAAREMILEGLTRQYKNTKIADHKGLVKFFDVSKLQYMVGAARSHEYRTTNVNLRRVFSVDMRIWSGSRDIKPDEITSVMGYFSNITSFKILDPIQLPGIQGSIDINLHFWARRPIHIPELMPIKLNNLWVLLATYPDELLGGNVRSIIFSPAGEISAEMKRKFGVTDNHLNDIKNNVPDFVEQPLLVTNPFESSAFVVEAVNRIAHKRGVDIPGVLQQFVDDFLEKSEQQQQEFSIQKRHQAFGYMFELYE